MASPESTYTSSSNVNDVLRTLMETGKDRTFTLKITPGLRKAFLDMQNQLAEAVSQYTIDDKSPLDGIKSMVGKSPKAITEVVRLLKNRGDVASVMLDKRGHKATNRDVDHILAAALLHVALMRMSLNDRGLFVYNHLPQAIYRAGGTPANTTFLKLLRKHVPWKDVAKMRKSRKLTASVRTADLKLFDKFKRRTPTDLVFDEIKLDPYGLWDKLSAKKMLDLLVAQSDGKPAIERSTQLLDLIEKTILAITPSTIYVRSMYDDSKRLADVFAEARAGGLVDLRKMMVRAEQNNYRAQLQYTDSIDNIMDTSAAYITRSWGAFKACLALGMAAVVVKDEERAELLHKAMDLVLKYNLMTPERLALMIANCFPWRAVVVMLQSRV